MPLPLVQEKWTSRINTVTIGADKGEGGTRAKKITVGGENTLPFLFSEGEMPHKPVVALEVMDLTPADWPQTLVDAFGEALKNPVDWAARCVEEYKADLVCLKLQSTHPDWGNTSAKDSAELVRKVLKKVGVPLIIIGSGDPQKDNQVLAECSQAAKGERCLIGDAVEKSYKTLTASCLADGHSIIAESPIDINIAKQVNILIQEMGLPLDRIVIYPTTGALGYGMEYAYSIMERARLAALAGDKMLSMPVLCLIGQEVWRVKESKSPESQSPGWGPEKERAIMWEITTAVSMLHAGGDILVLRHPKAAEEVRKTIDELMKKG